MHHLITEYYYQWIIRNNLIVLWWYYWYHQGYWYSLKFYCWSSDRTNSIIRLCIVPFLTKVVHKSVWYYYTKALLIFYPLEIYILYNHVRNHKFNIFLVFSSYYYKSKNKLRNDRLNTYPLISHYNITNWVYSVWIHNFALVGGLATFHPNTFSSGISGL